MKDLSIIIKMMMVEKKDVLLSSLFGFLAGIAAVGLFANSGYLISKAAIMPPMYVLTVSIAILKLFSVTRALSRYAERYYSHRATFTILSNLRVKFFEMLEPLAPRIFMKYRSGDLLSRIVGDVESLQNFFLRVYYPPIVMVIVFLSTIAFTLFFSTAVAITLIVGLLVTGFIIPVWFSKKQKRFERNLREQRGEVSTEATEFLYGFRDLKLYQKLDKKEEQLLSVGDAYVKEQSTDDTFALYSQSVNGAVSLIVSWFILGLGAYLVGTDQLNGVFLAMLVMISLTVFDNATPMAAFPSHYENSRSAAQRLFSVVEKEEEPVNQLDEEQGDTEITNEMLIEMKNVSFTYPGEGRPTLSDVNLTISAGSKTAIVGPSGSGKSTLLLLLLKLYQEYAGEIRIGNASLSKLTDSSVWRGTNVVLQNNHFFYGTIRDNLLLANTNLSDEEMKNMLVKVKLADFSLDDEVLEKGDNLSGGEKQRLAIARAMLKNSPLWLLDEPTSSVDIITEKAIYSEIFSQGKDDTMLISSHRLTGLEGMDQIVVMDRGTIVEVGPFEELMEKQGYFYEMKQIEKSVFH